MTPLRKRLIALLVLALAALAGWLSAASLSPPRGGQGAEGSGDAVISGKQLLALSFKDSNDAIQSFGQWKGKTLVVNFWATWCAPCRREIPDFAKVSDRYRDRGVQFVGLGIDTAENIARYASEASVPYPLLVGGTGALPIMAGLGNPSLGLPFTLLVDREGEIRMRRLGPMTSNMLTDALDAVLARELPRD